MNWAMLFGARALMVCGLLVGVAACGGGGGSGSGGGSAGGGGASSASSSASSVVSSVATSSSSSSATSSTASSGAASSDSSAVFSSATSSAVSSSSASTAVSSSVSSSAASSVASSSTSSAGSLSLFAGALGGFGYTDGAGASARFDKPSDVAVDASGNAYVADRGSHTVRKISAAGVVTTLAGSPRYGGAQDGTGSAARFSEPENVAIGASGTLYVADRTNYSIRKVTSAGVVTTLAGGTQGTADGTGASAQFNSPQSLTVDSSGNVFVIDGNAIRKITSAGVVTTFAGVVGSGGYGYVDATGSSARFEYPQGIAVGPGNDLYVATGGKVRKVTPAAVVTTVTSLPFSCGLNEKDLAVDNSGNIAVRMDGGICRINADGTTSMTGVASGNFGGMARDASGNVYFADVINAVIRKIQPDGTSSVLAGKVTGEGVVDGAALSARFNMPSGIVADSSSGNLFVADRGNNTLRKITSAGVVSTLAGTAGVSGADDGAGSAARFHGIRSGALDAGKNIYVVDTYKYTVRKITPAGVVTTLAGLGGSSGTQDGTGSAARFMSPDALAVDASGNVFVADSAAHTIRKISPAGVVTSFAGAAGVPGNVDATGSNARFNSPSGVAIDSSGNVYVSDLGNGAIRKISSAGVVSTVANATAIYAAAGNAGGVMLGQMTRDASNNIYIANFNVILKLTPAGVLSKVVGTADMRYVAETGALPGHLNVGFEWGNTSLAVVGKKLYITNESGILVADIP